MSSRCPSTCTYASSPRSATSRSNRLAQRSVAGDHEVRLLAELVHRDERVERAVGSLLLDEVPDEPDEAHVVGRAPSSSRSSRAASSRSTATNGSGSRKFGIAQIGPREAERAELVAEIGGERDRGVDAAHDGAPAQRARIGRHICGGKPRMRCHTISGWPRRRTSTAASTARPPCAITRSTGSARRWRRSARDPEPAARGPAVGAARQRREVDVFAAVEAEAEREHLVGVTERFEPARELDRDELRAAALAAGHEMQDPHGCIVPCSYRAPNDGNRRRR